MTYYLLPKTNYIIHHHLDCISSNHSPQPQISFSLARYLYEIKEKLQEKQQDWDVYKKYTNPYEYVHGIVPHKKKSISKYKPLSRSYFKMIELLHTFNIQYDSNKINTFHLAEGPGGFIEAIANLRKNPNDRYIGITLLDDKNDPNIPGWRKTDNFLKHNPNVFIETGKDKTGDILSLQNFEYCKEKYGSSMDLITADGGFDFSVDFNKQEINIARLLFAQISYAITLQKKGGCFILKLFDCFMQHSIDSLVILSSFYERVYIVKPNTSRYANSEKYIVCKGFLYSSSENFYSYIHNTFSKMLSVNHSDYIHRFLNMPISNYFITRIEEYNAIFGQQQIENIHYTITLIDNKYNQDKIDSLIKLNIHKAVQWCIKHNIPCHNNMTIGLPENIFLHSKKI
jgi:23S rRNA U2552 (ribose-2'-O)-methylase RlmE/FtsJ